MKHKNWVIDLVLRFWELILDLLPKKDVIEEMEYIPIAPEPIPDMAKIVEVPTLLPRQKLYTTAFASIGRDASPKDVAPDELACAESVNELYYKTFGRFIDRPGISTASLYRAMKSSPHFKATLDSLPGVIIISPTGYGNGNLSNGHVGICGKTHIMSNSSASGKWEANFTMESWVRYYRGKGGFPVYLFEPI